MLILTFASGAIAGEIRELELNDGSIVTGEVVSLNNGLYTVKSGSLGTLHIEESKVRTIRQKQASQNPPVGTDRIRERMMSNNEVMELIGTLQDDAAFKAILEDPELMKAVNAGDVARLMADPRFMKLLNHSTVQNIQKKIN